MSADRIPWIDLSAYGIVLHALRLPSGRAVLVAAGATTPHLPALAALGFRRTRQGHIVHPAAKLALSAVRDSFPQARVDLLARDAVVRIVPAPASPFHPAAAPEPANHPDHLIHNAVWLGVNRRGQAVYQDGAEHRFLHGPARGDYGPEGDVDFLRARTPAQLPDIALGLVLRAERGEALGVDDLERLAKGIDASWLPARGARAVSAHDLQEALEVAAARHLRQEPQVVGASAWRQGTPALETAFQAAARLARHLPAATQRTDHTLAWAQFSTPLPVAVAMRALLGPLGSNRSLLEPTAGHGALLLGLPADTRITAVEVDPQRVERLRAVVGARATLVNDDILQTPAPSEPYDYLVANPPYGSLADHRVAGGRTAIRFGEVDFPTRRLDHLIVLHALKQRHPLGRAVFLIGADHPRNHALDTPAGGSRYLLNLLGDHYHVEAVLGLHGDLYRSRGAGYPLRLLVVGERGAGFPAVPERTPVARDWDELWSHVEALAPRLGPSALERTAVVVDTPGAEERLAPKGGPRPTPAPATADDGASDPPALEDERDAAAIYQEPYVARSRIGTATTRAPANMAAAFGRALDRVEAAQGGSVDDYVSRELGLTLAALGERFAPEQIDALALVFHAHDRGRAFIEADETGTGKGRVLAGAALRAWRQGRPVIFLTEKANLFSDFYRDLSHIGMREAIRPLLVNAGVPVIDTERGHVLVPPARALDLQQQLFADTLPTGVNLVMATYSQLCREPSPKADWLCRIAEQTGASVIADESHNATGDSKTARNVQRLIEASGRPALFSSATYAKRPDSLALYGSALPALFRHDDLAGMLDSGGAPLQEAFSQMLAEDGVLVRREHDLSSITFVVLPDTARAERNRALADQLASILEKMAWLGGDIEAFLSEENQRLNALFDPRERDQRQGQRAGLQSMNFGSRLYQLNRLFLLALKVEHAIEFGARELEAGRKPIFVLENTLETLLREIITNQFDEDRTPSDALAADDRDPPPAGAPARGYPFASQEYPPMTYRHALRRVLARMMTYSERDRYGNTTRRVVDRRDLLDLAKQIERDIEGFPDLPLSPLDTLRVALSERGYRIGELSGRSFQVEWVEREDGRRMVVRPRAAEHRGELIYRFNTDVYQGLLMTRSGSTGLSAHARDDVPGWSPAPRSLFEEQIPQNVAERIQFWGRVNRRGQCVAPTVVTPSSELPGEVRLIAMQNAKLRKLSANTTSNQDNSALARNIPDLLNPLGNQVARRWAAQNPFEASRLDAEVTRERDALPEWYVNRILSRIMLFPVSEQEHVLEELAGLYQARLEELHSQGIQPLRTAEFDWKAREVQRTTFEATPAPDRDADSPFHAPIDFVTVEYEQARRPLRAARVRAAVAVSAESWKPAAVLRDFLAVKDLKLAQARRPHGRYPGFPSVEAALQSPDPNPVKRTLEGLTPIEDFLRHARIGAGIEWFAPDGATPDRPDPPADAAEERRSADEADPEDARPPRRGLLVAIRPPPREALHLAGHYQVLVACPGEERFVSASLHSLHRGRYRLDPPEPDSAVPFQAFDEHEAGTVTVRRNLLVGNLYAALQLAERGQLGRPVIYTTAAGARERGVLLPADTDFDLLRAQPVLLRTAEHLRRFIEDHLDERTTLVASGTGGRPERFKRGIDHLLALHDRQVVLTIPGAHSRNAALIHDPRWQALGITLEGTRTVLSGTIPPACLGEAVAVLGERHAWYAAPQYRDWYNGLSADPNEAVGARPAPDPPPQPRLHPPPLNAWASGVTQ